jgi:hypothetical protein
MRVPHRLHRFPLGGAAPVPQVGTEEGTACAGLGGGLTGAAPAAKPIGAAGRGVAVPGVAGCGTSACGRVYPHFGQKSAPSGASSPQCRQTAIAGNRYMRHLTVREVVRHRSVALVTRDPALYGELAGLLRERGWPSVSLLPGQRIPDRVAVVLTSPQEAAEIDHPRVLSVAAEGDRRTLSAAVEHALEAGEDDPELVVGIDPGPRPGFAILAGSRCLVEGILDSPESAGSLANQVRHRFPARHVVFRVGSGDPPARNRIVNVLLTHHRAIELVDEQGTTPRGQRRPRDAVAARSIARVRGHSVRERLPLTFTPGEISNLQRLSRERSGGRLTISRSSALRVLEGSVTLAEAVDQAGAPRPARAMRAPEPL